MKVLLVACVLGAVVVSTGALAREPSAGPPLATVGRADLATDYSRGAELASQLTQMTGVMLSPLLGMGAVGAYHWLHATPAERARLPWHDRPWVWGTMLALMVGLFFGHRIPVVKHVFKQLKLAEDKVSGLLAIPWVATGVAAALAHPVGGTLVRMSQAVIPSAYASGRSPTPSGAHAIEWLIGFVCAVLMGAAVWLVGHAVNVLCALSPFSVIDFALKSAKFCAIGVLLAAAAVSRPFGGGVALLYILIALCVSGWAFRLMVFGWVLSGDVLLLRGRRVRMDAPVLGFAASGLEGVPVRTLGHVQAREAGHVFRYRPWLVGPVRTCALPSVPLALVRGVISPVLASSADRLAIVRLPPRYRPHAAAVANVLGVRLEDAPAIRGWNAALRWMRDQLGRSRVAEVSPASE